MAVVPADTVPRVISVLLVRHAQSSWNATGRWQGQADPPLSGLGEHQATRAVERLGAFDAIVASPLQRAWRTAELIAEGLGMGPVLAVPGLVERDAGPWSGLTTAEIERGWPGALVERRFPAGFEPDEVLAARAQAAVEDLCAPTGGTVPFAPGAQVLAISHGGLIGAFERSLGEQSGRYPNLAGRWFHLDGGRCAAGAQVCLVEPTGGTWRPAAAVSRPE